VVRAAEGVRGGEEADDPRAVGEVGLLLLLPPVAGERAAARLAVEELVRGGHVHLGRCSAGGLAALLLALLLQGRRRLGSRPPAVAVHRRLVPGRFGRRGRLEEHELLLAVAVGAAAAAGHEAAEAPEAARLPRGGGLGERRGRVPRRGARRGPRRPRTVGVRRGRRRGGGLRRGRRRRGLAVAFEEVAVEDRVRREDAAVREEVVGRREVQDVPGAAPRRRERGREGELEPRGVVVVVVVFAASVGGGERGELVVRGRAVGAGAGHGVAEAEDGVEARARRRRRHRGHERGGGLQTG
jgi:hypothetical protein